MSVRRLISPIASRFFMSTYHLSRSRSCRPGMALCVSSSRILAAESGRLWRISGSPPKKQDRQKLKTQCLTMVDGESQLHQITICNHSSEAVNPVPQCHPCAAPMAILAPDVSWFPRKASGWQALGVQREVSQNGWYPQIIQNCWQSINQWEILWFGVHHRTFF